MFALRKAATKLASKTALQAARPLLTFSAVPVRSFADFNAIGSGAQKLSKSLEKEIKYENENYAQLEDIDTFLGESGFSFTESDGQTKMSLYKTVGDKTIEVLFESR